MSKCRASPDAGCHALCHCFPPLLLSARVFTPSLLASRLPIVIPRACRALTVPATLRPPRPSAGRDSVPPSASETAGPSVGASGQARPRRAPFFCPGVGRLAHADPTGALCLWEVPFRAGPQKNFGSWRKE